MREEKLSQEKARAQLKTFFDWYDLDFDEMLADAKAAGDDGEKPLLSMQKSLVKAIRQGRLEIREHSDQGGAALLVEQKLDHQINGKDSIVYHEVTAAVHIAQRAGKGIGDEARLFRFLATLAKCDMVELGKLRAADVRLARMLGYLFLAV